MAPVERERERERGGGATDIPARRRRLKKLSSPSETEALIDGLVIDDADGGSAGRPMGPRGRN